MLQTQLLALRNPFWFSVYLWNTQYNFKRDVGVMYTETWYILHVITVTISPRCTSDNRAAKRKISWQNLIKGNKKKSCLAKRVAKKKNDPRGNSVQIVTRYFPQKGSISDCIGIDIQTNSMYCYSKTCLLEGGLKQTYVL